MNKADAKKIAAVITRQQLAAMMQSAKLNTADWERKSDVNPLLTKGAAWNIFYPVFTSGRPMSMPATTNMVWEFGDFLPDDLKPKKTKRTKPQIVPHHEAPVFGDI